mmetsp:Transcript_8891/g.24626  ORF Transcript_8891/g.24626 Transcript_8891/m.24626 type:complete len:911 (-) Transcript_8891:186-2918(-)
MRRMLPPRATAFLSLLLQLFGFIPSVAQRWIESKENPDWLLQQSDDNDYTAQVVENVCWDDGLCGLELTNGLLTRRWTLHQQPAFGTVDLLTTPTAQHHPRRQRPVSLLRALEPEATLELQKKIPILSLSFSGTTAETTARNLRAESDHKLPDDHVDQDDDDDDNTVTISLTCRVGDLMHDNGGFRAYLNRTQLRDQLYAIPLRNHDKNNNATDSLEFIVGDDDEELPLCVYRYVTHRVVPRIQVDFDWQPGTRHSIPTAHWPPRGVGLEIEFQVLDWGAATATTTTQNQELWSADEIPSITLHYEMYDGIPAMAKWLSRTSAASGGSTAGKTITVESRESLGNPDDPIEFLHDDDEETVLLKDAVVERIASYPPYGAYFGHGSAAPYSFYNGESGGGVSQPPPLLLALTNQKNGMASCRWKDDFASSNDTSNDPETVHDMGASEPLLYCNYTHGPYIQLQDDENDGTFASFKTILLATDSTDPERYSLQKQRLIQTLLPHTTENPIFFHAIVHNDTQFRNIVDQMQQVGFEMLIYSFGSSFVLESDNTTYIETIKSQIDYAKARGIEVGGYDLICLQRGHGGYGDPIPDEWSTVRDDGSLTPDACYASDWVDNLHGYIYHFLEATGLSNLELDGPYGGGTCSATNHSHHRGREDSVYQQNRLQSELILKLRNKGVYVNAPDFYFFQGQNRGVMGYDEEQYSMPRWEQLTISRMGLYDDLYRFLPTQGWMFLPLSEYHAGGDAATFQNHPQELEWAVAQYLGAGTAAAYRGERVYDESTETGQKIKAVFQKWIGFYNRHRQVLIQPVVHLQRPTMQGWDGWFHVHPAGDVDVGLALIFNPTNRHFEQEAVVLPLYYTGLKDSAQVVVNEVGERPRAPYKDHLHRDHSIAVVLDMAPKSIHTIVVKRTDET